MRNFYGLCIEHRDAGFVYKEEKLCAFESLCSMYSAGTDEQTYETRITFLYCV